MKLYSLNTLSVYAYTYGLSNVYIHSQFELNGAKVCKCVLLLEINNVSTNFLSLDTRFILYHLPVFSMMEETLLLNRESPTTLDILFTRTCNADG